jgi:hypothetical protein
MAQTEAEALEGMEDEPGADEGQIVETAEDPNTDVTENDDGSATVRFEDKESTERAEEFYANLAETMEESELQAIARDLLEKLDEDKEARKERDKQQEEGLRRSGLGKDAPGGASFDGASKVVHPVLVEVAVDFAARAIKELFPPGGPAKDFIPGTVTGERVERAKRKVKWLNFQTTTQMPEFRDELETLLTQLPFGGNQYFRLYYNKHKRRPVAEFVPCDDVYLPYAAANLYSAARRTYAEPITEAEFKARVRQKIYRDIEIGSPISVEQTRSQKANDKIEGKNVSGRNIDNQRIVFEVAAQYLMTDAKRGTESDSDDIGPAPYLISIDESTHRVVSIYRNWDEDDKSEEALIHMVDFLFVPWRGAQGIGIPHMIGGLAGTATGVMRAILDAAMINNFPGGMKMKAGPMGGQNVRVDASQISEIDGAAGLVDDIRKLYMPTPISPPSPVLLEMLGVVVDAAKGVIKTTLDENTDTANTPVGTQMARIEQGMVVFSAIHARMHSAMGRVLKVLARLNATYLDDQQVIDETGEKMVTQADFNGPMDVIPVSDPNIFSEIQRFAQIQTIAQRSALLPGMYDQHVIEEAILERLKVADPKKYLIPKPEPEQMNAVNENIAMSLGRPVLAFPLQDHLAHIQVLCDFLENPLFGQNSLIAPTLIPPALKHLTEHLLFWYGTNVHMIGSQAAGQDISQLMNTKDEQIEKAFDEMIANASKIVLNQAQQVLGGLPAVIQKAQQLMQQLVPQSPPMGDPNQAKIQVTQMQTSSAEKIAAEKVQAEQAAAALKAQTDQQISQASDASRQQTTSTTAQAGIQKGAAADQTKIATTQLDNQTAIEIAAAEIAAGKHTNIKNGEEVGGKQPGM